MSDEHVSAETSTRDTGVVDRDNPWPGLAAFRESDQAFFHGRDAAIEALTELVTRARLSVLYGVSGLGKTSLIQAGLFPRARARDLFPVRIRLALTEQSEAPADQVCAALIREAAERRIEAPERSRSDTLWEFFYRKDSLWWNDRHHIVTPLLVFDQFEEIFTIARRHAGTARAVDLFLEELRGIVLGSPPAAVRERCDADPDQALRYSLARCPVRVLFSFREDYLAEFLELRDAFPAIGDQNFRLLRMSTEDAVTAIRRAGSHLVDETVARRIVDIIAASRSARTRAAGDLVVDPALLSIFCRELNNERRRKPQDTITDDLLQDKQARILENFYARSFEGLDPRIQVFVENELLLPDSAERNSIAEQVALRRPGVTAKAIEDLIQRRLLRRDERDGPARLELTHDVLIEPARRSRDVRLAHEAEERHLADARAAEEASRKAAAESQERERQALLLQVERTKVDYAKSEAQHQRDKRHRVQFFLGVAAVLALIAVFQWYRANREGTLANRALATNSLVQVTSIYEPQERHDIALAYLGEAARRDPANTEARARLVDSLLNRTWPVPMIIVKHQQPVARAQFAPDGMRILTTTADNVVHLWPVGPQPGEPLRSLSAPGALARADVTGQYVVAVTITGNVEVWDTETGRTVRTIAPEKATTNAAPQMDLITAAALNREATVVATGTQGGVIRLWRIAAAEPTPVWTNAEDHGEVRVLQFNGDGSRLLTWHCRGLTCGRQDGLPGVARILHSSMGQELGTFEHSEPVGAHFSPGGDYLVTASTERLRLWRVPAAPAPRLRRRSLAGAASLMPVAELNHEGAVSFVQFSADGTRVVTASNDGTVRIWKIDVFEPSPGNIQYAIGSVTPRPLRHRSGVLTAFFSADGLRVVTASKDNSARIWDAVTGAPLTEPLWHDGSVLWASFSANGQRVVTASDDRTAKVWDIRPGSALPETLLTDAPFSAQFSAGGDAVLVGHAGGAEVWSPATGQVAKVPAAAPELAPQFNADGSMFLTVDGNVARLWTTATAAPSGAPMDHGGSIIAAARFSPDGDRIATVTRDGNVRFWNARSGAALAAPMALPTDKDSQLDAVDLSRDLRFVALGTSGGRHTVAVWDVSRNPAELVTDAATPSAPTGVSVDPVSAWLLGTFYTDTVLLWPIRRPPAGSPVALVHDGAIVSARFSPQGDRVITVSTGTPARIWTPPAGVPSATLRDDQPETSASFSPNGDRVVTTSPNGTVRLWNVATGAPASLPFAHAGRVLTSEVSGDGEQLVTTCEDGATRVWHLAPAGRPADVTALAQLAQTVSGYEVRPDGTGPARIDDPIGRLEAHRKALDGVRGTRTLPQRIGEWVLADRWNRNISPFSATPIDRYLKEWLAKSTDEEQSVIRLYAGHPALRGKPGGQQ